MLKRPGLSILLLVAAALVPISTAAAADVKCVGKGFKLSGNVPDIHRRTECSGHNFRISLSDMRYVGEVHKTLLQQSGDRTITVWISLKNVQVTIGRINLSGRPGSAVCGKTVIDVANRREMWIAFDFERSSENGGNLLSLKKTRSGLHPDNWAVSSPAWVTTSGFGMSRNSVSRGVQSSLAASQASVQQQIEQIAHGILTEFAELPKDARTRKVSMEQALADKLVTHGHLSLDGHIVMQDSHTAIPEKGTNP